MDLVGTLANSDDLYQNSTLTSDSVATFSAYYSNREAGGGTPERQATLGIYNAAGDTLLSPLVLVDLNAGAKPSTSWTLSPVGSVALAAGTYRLNTFMGGRLNIDTVVVAVSEELQMSAGGVRVAKCRVLQRVRQELGDLLDE